MTDEEVAARFEAFVGRDAYVKFLVELNTKARRQWREALTRKQRDVWRAFQRTAPDIIPSASKSVFRILEVCHIHFQRLVPDRVPIIYGYFLIPEGVYEERERSFPFARTESIGGCIVGDKEFTDVEYCVGCREAQARWAAAQPADEGMEGKDWQLEE